MAIEFQRLVSNYRDYPKEAWVAFFEAIEAGQSIEQARISSDISPGALRRTMEEGEWSFDFCLEDALFKGGTWEEVNPEEEWNPEREWLERYGQGN